MFSLDAKILASYDLQSVAIREEAQVARRAASISARKIEQLLSVSN